jgi:glucokinase
VPGFQERFALADMIGHHVNKPVRVVNDVTAGAVAEHRLGAGRDWQHLLCVFAGTGVGGGLILHGQIFEGAHGGAGEFGHQIIRQGGAVCPCGRRGCVEAYAGRQAMTLAAQRAVADGQQTVLFEVMAKKGKPRPTSGVFSDALDQGDPFIADLIDDCVDALAAGIASSVNLLDLEAVVLGGGMADKLGEPFRSRVEAAMQPMLFFSPPKVELVSAALGDNGGAIGAGLLAREAT